MTSDYCEIRARARHDGQWLAACPEFPSIRQAKAFCEPERAASSLARKIARRHRLGDGWFLEPLQTGTIFKLRVTMAEDALCANCGAPLRRGVCVSRRCTRSVFEFQGRAVAE